MNLLPEARKIVVCGSTGYLGSRLVPRLEQRAHTVRALFRPGSESKATAFQEPYSCNPFDPDALSRAAQGFDTWVQLIGVPHPSPRKGAQFRAIDLPSIQAATQAAARAGISHFVYLSVAHPAPVMKEYIAVRQEGERLIAASRLPASIFRPWYVLGPGHRWAYALLPAYALLERIPGIQRSATRLGLVTLPQMLNALIWGIEHPTTTTTIFDVPTIRALANRPL